MKKKPIYSFFKRFFDIICSLLAIIILFIPMLMVAIAIKTDSKGPIIFKQSRLGKNKKTFKICLQSDPKDVIMNKTMGAWYLWRPYFFHASDDANKKIVLTLGS